MQVHEGLAQALLRNGHHTMFGLIGDANLFMVEQFIRRGGRYIDAAHESGAVLMANGYASVTNDVAICTTTHGPAVTNTVTALVEATRSRLPVVVIAGDTATGDVKTLQDIDQRKVVSSTGAQFIQASPSSVLESLAEAVSRARQDCFPVFLNVPADLQLEELQAPVQIGPWLASRPPTAEAHTGNAEDALQQASALVTNSRRPIVLAGRGAVSPRARNAMVELADHLGAPLATTLRAKGLFSDRWNDIGVCGTLSNDVAMTAIARSDCILAFGASLSPSTTDAGALFAGKAVVRCDWAPAQVKNSMTPDVQVSVDAARAAREILALLHELGETEPRRSWEAAVGHTTSQSGEEPPSPSLTIPTVVTAVEGSLDPDHIVVVDLGRFAPTTLKNIHVEAPYQYVHTASFGSIGLGMANAIGAACAEPKKQVVLFCGDGGFMHAGLAEFQTAVRHQLDIVIVIMNDRAYGAETAQYLARQVDPEPSRFDWPYFAEVAVALGGQGETISSYQDLGGLSQKIRSKAEGPLLVDVRLPPS